MLKGKTVALHQIKKIKLHNWLLLVLVFHENFVGSRSLLKLSSYDYHSSCQNKGHLPFTLCWFSLSVPTLALTRISHIAHPTRSVHCRGSLLSFIVVVHCRRSLPSSSNFSWLGFYPLFLLFFHGFSFDSIRYIVFLCCILKIFRFGVLRFRVLIFEVLRFRLGIVC